MTWKPIAPDVYERAFFNKAGHVIAVRCNDWVALFDGNVVGTASSCTDAMDLVVAHARATGWAA